HGREAEAVLHPQLVQYATLRVDEVHIEPQREGAHHHHLPGDEPGGQAVQHAVAGHQAESSAGEAGAAQQIAAWNGDGLGRACGATGVRAQTTALPHQPDHHIAQQQLPLVLRFVNVRIEPCQQLFARQRPAVHRDAVEGLGERWVWRARGHGWGSAQPWRMVRSHARSGRWNKWPFSTTRGDGLSLLYRRPVSRPCGMVVPSVAVNWAPAFRPMLLSNALVIRHPMPRALARSIHSREAAQPPTRLGLITMYDGRTWSSRSAFSSMVLRPIRSSSRAMGSGLFAQSSLMASYSPGPMGCSMLSTSSSASRCSTSITS